MRILLIGANGQVGDALRASLRPLGEVVCATRDGRLAADGSRCEVADLDAPGELADLLQRVRPDVVANAAAYTAVDRAEAEALRAIPPLGTMPASHQACPSAGSSMRTAFEVRSRGARRCRQRRSS